MTIVNGNERETVVVEPTFLFPHKVEGNPKFRWLDVLAYHEEFPQQADIPSKYKRQDGIYLRWGSEEIREHLTKEQRTQFGEEINSFSPQLYAFLPYESAVWGEINKELVGRTDRRYVGPGLMIGVNRQRLAKFFDFEPKRFPAFSSKMLALVHYTGAKPDQGRKTLQTELLDLADSAADRALQFLAKQRRLLRPAGEDPSPEKRILDRTHGDWIFHVREHAKRHRIDCPPLVYKSEPQTEQDVVGLFHQLAVAEVFPGIEIFATSQSHKYDCLIRFDCPSDQRGLRYNSNKKHILGLSFQILGSHSRFETDFLTVEFKNNLEALLDDLTSKDKHFAHIDICVCWSAISAVGHEPFGPARLFELEMIGESNLYLRKFPGTTHVLRKDDESHAIQVVMLKDLIEAIRKGDLVISGNG